METSKPFLLVSFDSDIWCCSEIEGFATFCKKLICKKLIPIPLLPCQQEGLRILWLNLLRNEILFFRNFSATLKFCSELLITQIDLNVFIKPGNHHLMCSHCHIFQWAFQFPVLLSEQTKEKVWSRMKKAIYQIFSKNTSLEVWRRKIGEEK